MKIIGITGGIGSGKSLVANILKDQYNAYILNTDGIAKEQMEPQGASYPEIVEHFGDVILQPDGRIDRSKLASIVFEDRNKRLKINEITHPKVLNQVKEEIEHIRTQGTHPYLVVETALMIEAGYDYICDEIWYVFTSEEERRRRLKQERGYSDEKIDSVFKSQKTEEAFRDKFAIVIENIGDRAMLQHQIDILLKPSCQS